MLARAVPIAVFGLTIIGFALTLLLPGYEPPFIFEQEFQHQKIEWLYSERYFRMIGQAAVTVVVLCAALFVIVSKRYRPPEKNWAFGAVGTVIGFWLRAPEVD
jgi:hypothetical protein